MSPGREKKKGVGSSSVQRSGHYLIPQHPFLLLPVVQTGGQTGEQTSQIVLANQRNALTT